MSDRAPEYHSRDFSAPRYSVIDVYSKWCGPCKAVAGLFRRIKNELGDDLLKFAIVRPKASKNLKVSMYAVQAEADDINTLELYRGKSQPCFLFYAVSDSVDIFNCICLMCDL